MMKVVRQKNLPKWPEYKTDGQYFVVTGKCPALATDNMSCGVGCLVMIGFFLIAGMLVSAVFGKLENPMPLITLTCMVGAAWFVYFEYFHGKWVSVAFSEKAIGIRGDTNGDYLRNTKIAFRIIGHEKVRLGKQVMPKEVEKLKNYGEIIMEYGAATVPVCKIASLDKAVDFVMLLHTAMKESELATLKNPPAEVPIQKRETTSGSPPPIPNQAPRIDPDDLPE
jgi:hypothetical protein